jgi:hypothetical protein
MRGEKTMIKLKVVNGLRDEETQQRLDALGVVFVSRPERFLGRTITVAEYLCPEATAAEAQAIYGNHAPTRLSDKKPIDQIREARSAELSAGERYECLMAARMSCDDGGPWPKKDELLAAAEARKALELRYPEAVAELQALEDRHGEELKQTFMDREYGRIR